MKHANEMKIAAVLGGGTMGHGIAQVLAQAGIATRLFDIQSGVLDAARKKVGANLEKGVAKGKVTAEDRDRTIACFSTTTDFAAAIDGADVVIEAVPEKMELKRDLFGKLGDALSP